MVVINLRSVILLARITFHRSREERERKAKVSERAALDDLLATDPMAYSAYTNAQFAEKTISRCMQDEASAERNIKRGLGMLVGGAGLYGLVGIFGPHETLQLVSKATMIAGTAFSVYSFWRGYVAYSASQGYYALQTFAMATPEYKRAKETMSKPAASTSEIK